MTELRTMHVTDSTPMNEIQMWVRERVMQHESFCVPSELCKRKQKSILETAMKTCEVMTTKEWLWWVNLSRGDVGLIYTPVSIHQ